MPAFQDLLTQLSSEYERVESALANAIAELRFAQGLDTCASGATPKEGVGWQDERKTEGPRAYTSCAPRRLRDSDDEEEEGEEEQDGEEQDDVCEHARSQSMELTPSTVEQRPSMEHVAEEDVGFRVLPVTTANVRSRGASGAPSSVPIFSGTGRSDRRAGQRSPGRHHSARSASKPSPAPPPATGSSQQILQRQLTPESACPQDTWQTYMNVKETPRLHSKERFTSPRQPHAVTPRMSRILRVCAPGVDSERDQPRNSGSGTPRAYTDAAMPEVGRLNVRSFQLASRWVINPENSAALERWDQITMVALAYVALVTPVQVSMLETKVDLMFSVNSVIDAVFFCDMILQFFIMYPKQSKGVYSLEHRHTKIIAHYLKTWFAIDILSIVPFDLFAVLSNSEGINQLKIVKAVRLMRLLKLMRVLKASRVFHRFQTRMSITYVRLALVKFFVILSVITHWLANLWALTLVIVDESDGLPRWVDGLTELETNVEVKTKDSPAKLYLACLYFTSYTITSVGYGDIGPQNISERVVLTFMVIVSGISWAVVLGQVCGIVANLDRDEQAFRSTMDELNVLMKDRLIPGPMRTRLRSFFLSNKSAQKKALQMKIVSAMSPGLRGEVSWEINRFWLDKVNFLRPCLQEASDHHQSLRPFVFDMSLMMQQVVCAQGEAFGVLHTMYILNRGLVGRLSRLLRSGSVWGSDFVLSDRRLLEPVDSHALTYVELTTLSRQHFFELVQRHSMSFPEIYRTVRRFCCWLAFQRALLIEARRRQDLLRGKNLIDIMAPTLSVSGARPWPQPPARPLTP